MVNGTTNTAIVDGNTISYGVVAFRNLCLGIQDMIIDEGINVSYQEAWEHYLAEWIQANSGDTPPSYLEQEFSDQYIIDEDHYVYNKDGYHLGLSYLGGAPFVMVVQSPIIVRANLCSPCIPNAGDLDSLNPGGFDTFGIPNDWYQEQY